MEAGQENCSDCFERCCIVQSNPDLIKIRGDSVDDLVSLGVLVFLRLNKEDGNDARKEGLEKDIQREVMMRPGGGWYGVSFKTDCCLPGEKDGEPTLSIQLVNGYGDRESQEKMRDLVRELLERDK